MKKILALVITLLLVSMLTIPALAAVNFDISPFENADKYQIEFDDMDDTGEIRLASGGTFLGTGDEDEDDDGLIIGSVSILILDSIPVPPFVVVHFSYIGDDWIFTDKVIIKPHDTRYTFEVNPSTDVDDGKIYESFPLVLTDESIQMLQDIVDNDVTLVKTRLVGSERSLDCKLIFDVDNLSQLLSDYKASGALDNDFDTLRELYPCTIK